MKWPFHCAGEAAPEAEARHRMVEQQIRTRGVRDPQVLGAMERVPRHAFVPDNLLELAYTDGPLPIGGGQTISQPYIVASMSESLGVKPGMKVLEIGTGSGYQAAVLAEMGLRVFTVEYVDALAREARKRLEGMGYRGIHFRCGDGNLGWPEQAPFDGILVTAAPADLPPALGEQLAVGARLVIPMGRHSQYLYVYRKNDDQTLDREVLYAVRFVPLVKG